jgi:hypothetical protein
LGYVGAHGRSFPAAEEAIFTPKLGILPHKTAETKKDLDI